MTAPAAAGTGLLGKHAAGNTVDVVDIQGAPGHRLFHHLVGKAGPAAVLGISTRAAATGSGGLVAEQSGARRGGRGHWPERLERPLT